MTNFHAVIRNVLSEVDAFFSDTIQKEKLSKKAAQHKDKILDLIFRLREDYPELLPKLSDVSRSDDNFIPDLGVRDLRNIAKAGFLDKRRKKEKLFHRSDYQRRYCVIQRNIFYYYISPTDRKQAGAFKLKGYRFRKAPYLPEDSQKKDLSFELSCPGKRSFQFLAETTQDFKEWKDAVEAANGDNSNVDNNSKPDGKNCIGH